MSGFFRQVPGTFFSQALARILSIVFFWAIDGGENKLICTFHSVKSFCCIGYFFGFFGSDRFRPLVTNRPQVASTEMDFWLWGVTTVWRCPIATFRVGAPFRLWWSSPAATLVGWQTSLCLFSVLMKCLGEAQAHVVQPATFLLCVAKKGAHRR